MNPRYEIRETIGQGGLGSVFKAFDTQLQREVAMKRVLTTGQGTAEEIRAAGDKLIAEAQTLSTLNHPNIVTVFDVGQDEEGGFVVMELLNGETLDDTVERGVLTAEDFKEVVFQTMEGLVAAQDKNVIHRDIKPTNIMLIWQASGRFQLKILDFGLAKFSKNPSVQTMDQDEAVMGSIFFMAPEQFERAELDARTDLYQMGCVYYNSLTGQYPFNGETAPQVMNAHLQHKVVPLDQLRPDLPPAVSQWVMWLINRDIASRPANAKEALKYFPKDTGPVPTLPAQIKIESTPVATIASSPNVKIATPGGNASAPPNLIVSSHTTGHFTKGSSTQMLTGGPSASSPIRPRTTTSSAGDGKKKFGPTMIVSIVGAIAIAIVGGMILLKKNSAAKNVERLEALHDADAPTGTQKDVDMLVRFMGDDKSPRTQKVEAYESLKKLQGPGIDQAILTHIKEAESATLQKQLSTVISTRGYTPAFETLLGLSISSKKDQDKVTYLKAASPLATSEHVPTILDGLKTTDSLTLRKEYEDTLASILHRSSDSEKILNQLRQRVKTATGGERRSLFRVLGLMGGEKTERLLDNIFSGNDVSQKADAVSAYFSWPNRSPLTKLALLAVASDPIVKKTAMRAYGTLSGKPGPIGIGQYIADWQKGAELMKDEPSEIVKMIQRVIVETPHPRTIGMLESWQEHPKYGRLSKAVADSMKQTVARMPSLEPGKLLKGTMARVEGSDAGANSFLESLTAWTSPETYFSWNFKVKSGGDYSISVLQADLNKKGSDFVIYVGGETFKGTSETTPNLEEFEEVKLDGKVTLQAGEIYKLSLVAGDSIQPRMMDIKAVVLNK
ncbi:MAG: serine/threonine-protein kinase [Verrucomicrobiales bacterium]|nr:serine/threonine-protein kinase [Verrucomicrobiales bacterium]